MEHVLVWENANGRSIPKGMQIHHRDENPLKDGEWWKPCTNCGDENPVSDHYKRHDGISPWCRKCCIENAVMNKRKRKAKARSEARLRHALKG